MAISKKTSSAASKSTSAKKSPAKAASKSAPKKSAAPKSALAKSAKTANKTPAKSARTRPAQSSSADSVDEQLGRYRSMRDFKITAEPSGSNSGAKSSSKTAAPQRTTTSKGLPFVIQKHAASHLHYDFRLGWNGVLKSWAVAKGPSYYPGDRRLAVEVEDHPMEYGGFEGIIPKGQYGGGTVMVWDQGTWWPQPGYENVDAGLRDGSLKFVMNGAKMHGKWTLVRMKPRPGSRWGNSSKPNWLLIKEHDDFERGPNDPAITDTEPNSAVTGRTMEQIAKESDHVWNSNKTTEHWNPDVTAGAGQAWYRRESPAAESPPEVGAKFPVRPRRPAPTKTSPSLNSLPRESQPQFIPPELAEESATPPDGADWLHEIKLDGYRIQARKSGQNSTVQMLTRKGLDWAHRMRAIADAIAALPYDQLTLDGEVVVLDENGISSFASLQASFQNQERHPLSYFIFDLLHLNGHNTRNLSLRERKALLKPIIPEDHHILCFSDHLDGSGPVVFRHACELGTEGIISKRNTPYISGRTSSWLKSKCRLEQELVIAGFTPSTEGPNRIGSVLLGYYEGKDLIYAGRSGTGFTQKTKRELRTRLGKLERKTPAFIRVPPDAHRDAVWVEPKLVAQIRFANWTADHLVRQAAFLGLREDKPPAEVRRERPTVAPRPQAASHHAVTPLAARTKPAANHAKTAHSTTAKPKSSAASKSPGTKAIAAKSSSSASIRLTHPTKILDPQSALTKQQLADYYFTVAERMLPHIVNRPLSLVRCPEGAGKECFFQKHVNHMLPPGITGVDVPNKKTGEPEPYITITEADAKPETLAGLAQMGVLEVHPWGSQNNDLEHPDRIIFDLDPDESLPWSTLTEAAAEVRKRLKRAGLESFLKTTGGKGLHVVFPIEPKLDWPTVKEAAHGLVLAMERSNPALYLTKMTKSARAGKIYLDYLRNERGATAVAPFSPRARLGTPVSLPLPWSALKLPERPIFRVADLPDWRDRLRSDPWKDMPTLRQTLDPKALAAN
jgi:bifunctional non-homologous end joining protein LigD